MFVRSKHQLSMLRTAIIAALALCVHGTAPHIIYVLIDDFGWAGLGFNSPTGEPKTPYIDGLRAEGMQLNRFYTYKVNRECNQAGGGMPVQMTTIAEVLKTGGYNTHHIGKWHVGMSVRAKIPINRGFDSSLGMLGGSQHHFTQVHGGWGKVPAFVDLFRDHGPAYGENGTYSSYLYTGEAVRLIKAHDTSKPMFMFLALPLVHDPLEVPDEYLNLYDESIYGDRRIGLGMISAVDASVASVTEALKETGMYGNTLILISSDNGGVKAHESNYPLRGCKSSNFDGGTRVVAFVSGGFLPSQLHGSSTDALMHIAGMYATFASFAGVNPTDARAAAAGLPPIDSIDMADIFTGQAAVSKRTELMLTAGSDVASAALIRLKHGKLFKLVRGTENNGFYPGPTTPNGTTAKYPASTSCPSGCLFGITDDEVEHVDITAALPDRQKKMMARIELLEASLFQEPSSTETDQRATVVGNANGGWWAPWEDAEEAFV